MKTNAIRLERIKRRIGARWLEQTRAEVGQAVGSAVIGFLLGAGSMFGAIAPFPVAAVAALPLNCILPGTVGSLLGCLLFTRTQRSFPLIIAGIVIVLLRLLAARVIRGRIKPVFLSLLAFGVMALASVFYSMVANVSGTDFLLLVLESVLAGSFTYFFVLAGETLARRRTIATLTYAQWVSVTVLFLALICSLTSFEVFQVNIGALAAVLSIYIAMNRKGIVGGSMTAIAAAAALLLGDLQMLEFSGILIIASFVAGAFSPLRKLGQLVVFLAVSVFGVFVMGAPVGLVYRLVEVFLASAGYVLLPERWLDRLYADGELLGVSGDPAQEQDAHLSGAGVSAQLAFASDTIRELREELAEVSDRFSQIDAGNISSIYDAASEQVCRGCSMALACWDDRYNETVNAFHPISDTLRMQGEVAPDSLPAYFRERCCKPEQLCQAVNAYYRSFVNRQNAKRQTAESRRIVFEQFQSMADMLVEISEEIADVTAYDTEAAAQATAVWNRMEREAEQILCPVDRYGRMRIEIYTKEPMRTSGKALCLALCEATGRDFDLPSISVVGGKTRISLFEKANCGVSFAAQQICCRDNAVCGDSYEYFTDTRGYAYLLLSDGMGNGNRAAVDSAMTCSVLSKLLKAGFGLESAMRLLNSSLLVKSADESMATVDLLRIDLYSGEAALYKAGAAATFVYSGGEMKKFASSSLPVGILEGTGYERQTCRLHAGDIVVLASDGAAVPNGSWIGDRLRGCSGMGVGEIAADLIEEARKRSEIHPDDITILVAKIEKGI